MDIEKESPDFLMLQEMAALLTRKKLMKMNVLGQAEEGKLHQLYLALVANPTLDDEQAVSLLYGESTESNSAAFQKTKSKLRKRLREMKLMVDNEEQVPYFHYTVIPKKMALAKLLYAKGAVNNAIFLAHQALAMAQEFYDLDSAMEACGLLSRAYCSLHDHEKHLVFSRQYLKLVEASSVERLVEERYAQLMGLTINEASNGKEIATLGEQYFEELQPFLNQYDFAVIQRFIRVIQVNYLLYARRYHDAIEACQAALDIFNEKFPHAVNSRLSFMSVMITCYTILKDYPSGKPVFEQTLALSRNMNNRSLYKALQDGILLAFYGRQYQQAYSLGVMVFTSPSYGQQPLPTIERWHIYKAYIQLLIDRKKITPHADDAVFTGYKAARFNNDLALLTKDKQGYNISVLIIRYLFLIVQGRFEEALDRIDGFQRYLARYVDRSEYPRVYSFVKMLLLCPVYGFGRTMTEKEAQKYLLDLRSFPLERSLQPLEVEIIPFEDLWELVLDALE